MFAWLGEKKKMIANVLSQFLPNIEIFIIEKLWHVLSPISKSGNWIFFKGIFRTLTP